MTCSKLLLPIGILVVAASGCASKVQSPATSQCSFDSSARQSEAKTSFLVGEIKANAFRLGKSQADGWSVTNQNTISFATCLTDIAFLNKISGQEFIVQGGDRDQRLRTDADGCLTWKETFRFNPAAEKADITVVRSFKPVSVQKGAMKASVAVNPWDGTAVDLCYGAAPKAVAADSGVSALLGMLSGNSKTAKSSERLPKLRLESVSGSFVRADRGNVTLNLNLQPKIRSRALDGHEENRDLDSGRFRVSARLVELMPYGHDNSHFTAGELASAVQETVISAEHPIVSLKMASPNTLAKGFRHQLVIRLDAIKAPFENLAPEEVAVELAADDLINVTVGGDLIRPDDSYDDYVASLEPSAQDKIAAAQAGSAAGIAAPLSTQAAVTGVPTNPETLLKEVTATNGTCQEAFSRAPLRIRTWTVTPNGRSGRRAGHASELVPGSLGVTIKACLEGPSAIEKFPYKVGLLDADTQTGREVSVHADMYRCVSWQDTIDVDFLDPQGEHWLRRTLRVSAEQAPIAGDTQSVPLALDPWQSGAGFMWDCTVAKVDANLGAGGPSDAGNGAPADIAGPPPLKPQRHAPRVFLRDFAYSYIGNDFTIDRFLNLTMKRKYQIRFSPRIERTDGLTGQTVRDPMPETRLKLRVLVAADPAGEKLGQAISSLGDRFVSAYEREIEVRSGEILSQIEVPFDFQDFPRIADRDLIYVELLPLGDDTVPAYSAKGYFYPLGTGGSAWLVGSNQSTEELQKELAPAASSDHADVAAAIAAGKPDSQLKQSAQELFAATTGIKALNDKDLEALGIRDQEIEDLISTGKPSPELAQKLCQKLRANRESLGKNAPGTVQNKAAPSQIATFRAFDGAVSWLKGAFAPKGETLSAFDCARAAEASLDFTLVRHVQAVHGDPVLKDASLESPGTSTGQSRDANRGRSQSDSVSVNAGASATADLGGVVGKAIKGATGIGIGFNGGGSWSRAWSESVGESQSSNTGYSSSKSLFADKLTFDIAADTQACVVVEPARLDPADRYNPKTQTGLELCSRTPRSETLTESYYYLVQAFADSATLMRDTTVRGERPYTATIRGAGNFEEFRAMLLDQTKRIVLKPESTTDVDATLKGTYSEYRALHPAFSDGAFPGTFIQP